MQGERGLVVCGVKTSQVVLGGDSGAKQAAKPETANFSLSAQGEEGTENGSACLWTPEKEEKKNKTKEKKTESRGAVNSGQTSGLKCAGGGDELCRPNDRRNQRREQLWPRTTSKAVWDMGVPL